MPTADEMKLHYEAQSPADESPQQEWKYLHPHREAAAGESHYRKMFHSELALISFVCIILGLLLPPFSTLAIVFGIGGLMQIHREGMKGKWLAIAGILLGFVGIFILIILIMSLVSFIQNFLATLPLNDIGSFLP